MTRNEFVKTDQVTSGKFIFILDTRRIRFLFKKKKNPKYQEITKDWLLSDNGRLLHFKVNFYPNS